MAVNTGLALPLRPYFQNYRIDSNQILRSDKDHQMPFVGSPHTLITNLRWRTAAILGKIEKSPYFGWKIQDGGGRHLRKSENSHNIGRGMTDFDEIWHDDAVLPC